MGRLKSLGAFYGNPLRIWCLTREFCHPFLVLGCEMMIHLHAHVLLWRGDILAEPLVKSVKTLSSTGAFLEVFPTPNTYIPVTVSCTCTSAPDTRPPPGHSRALCWCCAELCVLPVALSRHRLPLRSGSARLRHRGSEWILLSSKGRSVWSVPCVLGVPVLPLLLQRVPHRSCCRGVMVALAAGWVLSHRQAGGCRGDFCNESCLAELGPSSA